MGMIARVAKASMPKRRGMSRVGREGSSRTGKRSPELVDAKEKRNEP